MTVPNILVGGRCSPMFDIIDLIGKSSTFLLVSSLWIIAVSYNLPGEEPAGYTFE